MMNRSTQRISILLIIILVAAGSISAQSTKDRNELTRLLNEFLAGASRNDPEVHDRFWAEDLIYTRSSGVRTNKEELMKGVRSAPPRKETDPVTVYSAEEIKIQLYDDAAVVAFKLVGTTTTADGTKSVSNHLNTGTFVKRNGKWQVAAWQATTVPASQPTIPTRSSTSQKPDAVTPEKVSAGDSTKPVSDSEKRTYEKGPRGGCFFVNSEGSKVYVDKKYCP